MPTNIIKSFQHATNICWSFNLICLQILTDVFSTSVELMRFSFILPFQIFDASTNTWKIVNERSHTDFVEKIIETPRETIIIDDITDITKIKSINDRTERTTDITDITDINRVKNTINLHETEENILREVTKENVLVRSVPMSMLLSRLSILNIHVYSIAAKQ